jgi:hypothetical protein
MGMGVRSWWEYNLKFKGRTFNISLNEVERGFHQAKGIRWDFASKTWISVPKPNSYIEIEHHTRFGEKISRAVQFSWNTYTCEWDEDPINLPQTLYRNPYSQYSTLNCFNCHSGNRPCNCPSVLELRQMLMGYSQRTQCNWCPTCDRTHTTPMCLVCSGDYTKASLNRNETVCSICHDHLNEDSVSVQGDCFHCFHEHCIERWRSQNNTCPMCRYKYPPFFNSDSDDGHSDDGDSDDGHCDDGDSDYDPMDDCSDCGNPNCPCQYLNRHR